VVTLIFRRHQALIPTSGQRTFDRWLAEPVAAIRVNGAFSWAERRADSEARYRLAVTV
jgi:hypothetical protein